MLVCLCVRATAPTPKAYTTISFSSGLSLSLYARSPAEAASTQALGRARSVVSNISVGASNSSVAAGFGGQSA